MIFLDEHGAPHRAAEFTTGTNYISSGGAVPYIKAPLDEWARSWKSHDYVYRTNPWLWAVGDLLARTGGRMPMKCYQGVGNDRKRVLSSYKGRPQRLAMALENPGFGVSRWALRYGTIVDRIKHGNALWRIQDGGDGQVIGFRRIPWAHVQLVELGGAIGYHEQQPYTAGAPIVHHQDDVIHFGFWHDTDRPDARSPIEALHATLALHDAVLRQLLAYFANSARPEGVWRVDRATPQEEMEAMAEMMKLAFGGPDRSGKSVVTTADWKPITTDPQQMQVIELAKQSRVEICAAFGVAPPLVGILEHAIQSNVGELREHTARDATGPRVESDDADLQAQLWFKRPQLEGVYVESDFGAALKSSVEAASKTWPQQLRVLTPNEIRRRINEPQLDDERADELWWPNAPAPASDGEKELPENEQPEPEPEQQEQPA